jgi:hypothetical protein
MDPSSWDGWDSPNHNGRTRLPAAVATASPSNNLSRPVPAAELVAGNLVENNLVEVDGKEHCCWCDREENDVPVGRFESIANRKLDADEREDALRPLLMEREFAWSTKRPTPIRVLKGVNFIVAVMKGVASKIAVDRNERAVP